VLVHFDVDSIDSADFPLADFPHHNQGMPLSDALDCLRVFLSSPKCGGLVLTDASPAKFAPTPQPNPHFQ
jgi:arginase